MAFPNIFIDPRMIAQASGMTTPSTSDPYSELTKLITTMQGQTMAPPPQGNLEQILNAIAQAAAITASPEPGVTLSNTLKGRQERKDKQFEFNQARQANLENIKLQAAIQRATDLAREQAEVRKEIRGTTAEIAKEKRGLDLLKQKGAIEIDFQKNLAEMNEALAQKYEPMRLARERNRFILQDYPQQRKDKVELSALMTATLPNLDPVTADVIAAKRAGLDPEPLTPEEIDLIKMVNQKANQLKMEERGVKLANVKSETSRNLAEAAYTRAGKPGQDRFANAYNAALGRDAAEGLSSQYVRTATGEVMSIEDANRHPIHKFNYKLLPPQENDAEQLKAAKKIVEQRRIMTESRNAAPAVNIPDKIQRAFEVGKQKNYSDEQIKVLLKANGATPEQINQLVPPVSPQAKQEAEKGQVPKTAFERAMEAIGKGFKVSQ